MTTTRKRKSHRGAIVRALTQRAMEKAALIAYLGAQDAHDAVDYDLQKLRRDGFVEVGPHRKWRLTREGILNATALSEPSPR